MPRSSSTAWKSRMVGHKAAATADMLYTIATWRDRKNSNDMTYTVLYGTGCFVQYSAIKSAASPLNCRPCRRAHARAAGVQLSNPTKKAWNRRQPPREAGDAALARCAARC